MDCTTLKRMSCVLVVISVAVSAIANAAPTLGEPTFSPISTTSQPALPRQQQNEGRGKMSKRIVLPLLVGILLKVASLLPVILGKLTLMGVVSIMTSKLALFIAAILAIHKFQSDSSWHTNSFPSDDSYSYAYRRRG